MRWFNDKVLEKKISFSKKIKEKNITFKSIEYSDLIGEIRKDAFVYMDPPYRHTNGSYNDGKRGFNGWGLDDERKLFEFADLLNKKSINFMLSYVAEHRGKVNSELKNWVTSSNYSLISIESIPGVRRKEVLILNYDQNESTEFYNKK